MGRFIQTGTTASLTTCYQIPNHKYSYDANECWQNRVVLDVPGSYTFQVPAGVSCIRTVAVGGGGKALMSTSQCNIAGSGGAYVESVNTIVAGCTITVVVGRQQQDTTIAYTCSGGGAVTHTAGGAVCCTPGTASTTNAAANILMCSNGGQGGCSRNYQEAYGTCPSTCLCLYPVTCCGYCIVYGCNCIGHHMNDACTPYFPGGGSAGSFTFTCGGRGACLLNKHFCTGNNDTGGPMAGGGGGIGYPQGCVYITAFCNCVCNWSTGHEMIQNCGNASASGGGGSRWTSGMSNCDTMLWSGLCENGNWREGSGGWGGLDNQEGRGGQLYWVCHDSTGCHKHFRIAQSVAPKKYPWHDIHSMSGSGSSGKSITLCGGCWAANNCWARGYNQTGHPEDSGEGAGTGGAIYGGMICDVPGIDWPAHCLPFGVDWLQVCDLGVAGKAADVYYRESLAKDLVPGFISRAGTLGGSGGIGVLGYASKAGFGGGAGHYKRFVSCVCWGGSFDLCNGSGPALAFPPCILDNIVNNAGSGMAIIYWKDA
jgi:hypothetical protein